MRTCPSRIAEAVVALLVPPACREEVLGDLHERYRSPVQYAVDALRAIPCVILSRMRRITDPRMLLMRALVLYLSFLSAACVFERTMLDAQFGLVRLALPAAMMLLGSTLGDVYADPARRYSGLVKGSLIGAILATLSQALLCLGNSGVCVPRLIFLYGGAVGLLLSSAVRWMFAPGEDRRKEHVMLTSRYVAVACTLVVLAGVLFWGISKAEHPGAVYTYSQFLRQVSRGQVSSVVVTGTNSGTTRATFTLKDGKTARTVLPLDYRDALRVMRDNLVEIEIRDSLSDPRGLLAKSAPFLLVLGVWLVMIIFNFPARFKHSN